MQLPCLTAWMLQCGMRCLAIFCILSWRACSRNVRAVSTAEPCVFLTCFSCFADAGKVTGMLLELTNADLLDTEFLSSCDDMNAAYEFEKWVSAAMHVLECAGWDVQTNAKNDEKLQPDRKLANACVKKVSSPTSPREAPPATSSYCRQSRGRFVLFLRFLLCGCRALRLCCVQCSSHVQPLHDTFTIDASSREIDDAAIKSPALDELSAVEVMPRLSSCADRLVCRSTHIFRPHLPPCVARSECSPRTCGYHKHTCVCPYSPIPSGNA